MACATCVVQAVADSRARNEWVAMSPAPNETIILDALGMATTSHPSDAWKI